MQTKTAKEHLNAVSEVYSRILEVYSINFPPKPKY